jgi:hypothetical protein
MLYFVLKSISENTRHTKNSILLAVNITDVSSKPLHGRPVESGSEHDPKYLIFAKGFFQSA